MSLTTRPVTDPTSDPAASATLPDMVRDLLAEWGLGATAGWLGGLVILAVAVVLAFVAYQVARRLVVRKLHGLAEKTRVRWDDVLVEQQVFQRLAHLVPGLVIYLASPVIFPQETPRLLLERIVLAYMVLAGAFAVTALLTALRQIYESSFEEGARQRPIRSYIQVAKIFLWVLASFLVIGVLMDKSPWGLVTGLGAATAIILLVFKDSILGLMASIKLTANDMVRVGDWIEMPDYGADGDVVEILLTTVKVRNWDMTITTIPSYKLIEDAFKNWRGMFSSGVRRIRRPVLIDVQSIRFVDAEMLKRYKKIQYIQEYLDRKVEEVQRWNEEKKIDESSLVNGRKLTNVGTFRAYLESYLRNLPIVDPSRTLMVHQLPVNEKGLPLMLYCFSTETRWAYYEGIQADIFDHVLAVVREFDLRVVQLPTGGDVRTLASAQIGTAEPGS